MTFPRITVARRRRLKYIRIAVQDAANVRLTVPVHYTDRDIQHILDRKRDWIVKHVHLLKARTAQDALSSTEVLFLGDRCRVEFHEFATERIEWRPEEKLFVLRGDLRPHWKASVAAWQRGYAKTFIVNRVHELNEWIGFSFRKISIRSQRTRWGSCSSTGSLSFNWKLIKAPPDVLDYVIYHELAHLKVFSHSKAYWALVASICPHYNEARKWLRQHGHVLHA